MKKALLCAALSVALAGCANSSLRISGMDATEIRAVPDMSLCSAGSHPNARYNPEVERELIRRGLLTESEWILAEQGKVRIGMSECAAMASWGRPSKVNRSTSRYGTRQQWVYRSAYGPSANYLYFEDGRLSGIQN